MHYREERELTIRIRLSATFGEDYEGEEDGYEWHRAFDETIRPRILRAVLEQLTSEPRWRVTPSPRGESQSEVIELKVERIVEE